MTWTMSKQAASSGTLLEYTAHNAYISTMIQRHDYLLRIDKALGRNPIAMLVGPRQVGKSTLAALYAKDRRVTRFDLEHPTTRPLIEQPLTMLEPLRGLVVIDEAQRAPDLFPVLRVLADRPEVPARFLLLGSASPHLSRQANESLAGRVEIIEVRGFSVQEIDGDQQRLWLRGGFPRSYLAGNEEDSFAWRDQFIRTFIERDLGLLGFGHSIPAMGRFWAMLAHYHGQLWNASELAASMGVSQRSVNRYLDALEETFMVRRLQPWHENVGKRIVKSPKIYLRDTGILHAHLRIATDQELLLHPKLGASWEGFALEQLLTLLPQVVPYFYKVHSGTELDLFFLHRGKRIGVEVKREDAPRTTRSMHVAMDDLGLDELWVVYPGSRSYPMGAGIRALPFTAMSSIVSGVPES